MNKGQSQPRLNDEIDLVELVQSLWAEKLLISAFVVISTLAALAYSFSVAPQYSSQAIVAPAPLSAFGSLAGALDTRTSDQPLSGIGMGLQLANDAFAVFATNMESQQAQRKFSATERGSSPIALQVTRGRTETAPVAITATAAAPELAKEFLDGYMNYAAATAAIELNEYFAAMNIDQRIDSASLYRLEQPAAVNPVPVKPRRSLIVALGFVLGGMLGVFVALIRIMLKKRADSL